MHKILIIARGTVLKRLRGKVLYLPVLTCLCLILVGLLHRALSAESGVGLMRDLGLAGISLVGMVTAVLVGSNEVGKELREGTVETLLAKPLSRDEFILGKYLGTLFVALINIAVITAGFLIVMSFYDGGLRLVLIGPLILNVFEVSVLIAAAVLFATFLPEMLGGAITFLMFLMVHGAHMLFVAWDGAQGGVPRVAAGALYYIIPNLHRLNIRLPVGDELAIPWSYVGCTVIYGLCYTGMALSLSVLVFRKREL